MGRLLRRLRQAKTPPPPDRSPAIWRALTLERAWIFSHPLDHQKEQNLEPMISKA